MTSVRYHARKASAAEHRMQAWEKNLIGQQVEASSSEIHHRTVTRTGYPLLGISDKPVELYRSRGESSVPSNWRVEISENLHEMPKNWNIPPGWFVLYESGNLADATDLTDALEELSSVVEDAEEDNLDVPSKLALGNAKRLLHSMYRISPRRYGVYPVSDGYVAIDARGIDDSIAVVMCGSDGEVLCLVTINGEHRRARYSHARNLPDGFIREALLDIGKIL